MSPVTRTTFRPILVLLRLLFIELWANTRQNDDVRSLTFEVTAHVGDAGRGTPTYTKFEVCRPSRSEF